MASPEYLLLSQLIEHAASAVSSLVAGAPPDEVERQHALAVSRRLKAWQASTGATEPSIPLPFAPSPSEPPRHEEG